VDKLTQIVQICNILNAKALEYGKTKSTESWSISGVQKSPDVYWIRSGDTLFAIIVPEVKEGENTVLFSAPDWQLPAGLTTKHQTAVVLEKERLFLAWAEIEQWKKLETKPL